MIVLDTNVISEIIRPEPAPQVVAWAECLTGDVAITAVTLAEIFTGLRRLPEGRRQSALTEQISAMLEPYRETRAILPFDDRAAAHYAEVLVTRDRAGRPIHTADAQIAAICRAHGATCATRNTKDFAGTGVELIDPWAA